MKIYKYWARSSATVQRGARRWDISSTAGSDTGLAEAMALAREKAERISQMLSRGETPPQYAYTERPLQEELIGEIMDEGQLIGAITRNSYGSLVLNAVSAMFVDIDCKPPGCLAGLFGIFGGGPKQQKEIVERVKNVAETTPGLGLRLYQTAAGYRCLITSGTHDPSAAETRALLERFGSDPLYIKLCAGQACFRARLTPKFWRCNAPRPPSRYPWANAEEESRYRKWEKDYAECAKDYATCSLVGSFGSAQMDARVQKILEVHDRFACSPTDELADLA
jgi:hypothetical protein